MLVRAARVFGLTAVLSLLFIAPASAYIDPGSTTVVFQAIVAGIAAAGVSIGMFWSRITGFFRRGSSSTTSTPDAANESAPSEA